MTAIKGEQRYDVAVVGGGPAGATSAFLLSRKGFRVVLLEKCSFPRAKVCAGLLTWKTLHLVKQIFGITAAELKFMGIIESSCRDYCVFCRQQKIAQGRLDFPFHFVDRAAYDHLWLQLARQSGVQVRTGEALTGIDLQTRQIVTSKGNRIQSDVVIAADGVLSRVRKAMAPQFDDTKRWRNQLASTLEMVQNRPPAEPAPGCATLHFGHAAWGYIWQFPGRNRQTFGIAALGRKNKIGLKSVFMRFLAQQILPVEKNQWLSHPLPYGNFTVQAARGRFLLVGDACGLADPLLGEGIYYAHRSAQLAARAITACRPGYRNLDKSYQTLLKTSIYKELRWIRFYRDMLFLGGHRRRYRGLRLFFRLFPKNLEAAVQGKRSFSQLLLPNVKRQGNWTRFK